MDDIPLVRACFSLAGAEAETRSFPEESTVVVGRKTSADGGWFAITPDPAQEPFPEGGFRVEVDDRYVSEQHARLGLRKSTIWAEDLGSANGTTLEYREGRFERVRVGPNLTVTLGAAGPREPAGDGTFAGDADARRHALTELISDALHGAVQIELVPFSEQGGAEPQADCSWDLPGLQERLHISWPMDRTYRHDALEVLEQIVTRFNAETMERGEGLWKFTGITRERTAVLERAKRICHCDTPVLIMGGSGTGKEVLARDIHRNSGRRDGPLVVVDCTTLKSQLMESELFGHEKGAFTGADAKKVGLVELAHKGTLFVDEVGELPLELQPKLLRFLQERTFRTVGGTRDRSVDVRVVAATNRDMAEMVKQGTFREDLYHRLKVIVIRIPPLSGADLGHLAKAMIRELTEAHFHPLAPDELVELTRLVSQAAKVEGNVRALRNRLEAFLSFRQGHPSIIGGGFLTRPQVVAVWRESEDPDAPLRPEAEDVHRADLPQWLWRLLFLEAAASAGTVKQLCEELKITYPTYKSYRDKFGLGAKDLTSEEGRARLSALAEESRRMLRKQPYLRDLLG